MLHEVLHAIHVPGVPAHRARGPVYTHHSLAAVQRVAACPACHGSLTTKAGLLRCEACGVDYPIEHGQPDLRPHTHVFRDISIDVPPLTPHPEAIVAPLPPGPWPPVPFPHKGSFTGGNRLSDVLTTYLPPAAPGDLLLDLGCGEGVMGFQLARERRYEYIGVDVAGEGPTALADAHALPFDDGGFAACCTFAVLEHLRVPRLAALELARVLRPGGTLIGTVAFLEPLHEDSYFHHTHYGLHDILASAGFEDIRIEANESWRATDALFSMYTADGLPFGRYLRPLVGPVLRLLSRSTRFTTSRHPEELRRMTGGYRFVARRGA